MDKVMGHIIGTGVPVGIGGALAALVLLVGGFLFPWGIGISTRTFHETKEVFGNPLMGYAPGARYEEVSADVQLLYMDITWRELEPEEGVYAWETIAEENQLARWRAEGRHMVLRFVCDLPGDESHMDIPDWLYERMDGAGTWYDMDYGKGFSPDYASEEFIRLHTRAVEAMGQYLGQDGFVSYVELGSLGHWGEWHVNYSTGIDRLPSADVRDQYVAPWAAAFPQAKLLMRRPFAAAARYGTGLYNDMAGEPESTADWLKWIREGGSYDQTGEEDALVPMEDAWAYAPIGGEFTSAIPMKDLLETGLSQTKRLVEQSHMTFLGPKIAEKEYETGYEEVLGKLGYRLWISRASLRQQGSGTVLDLTWENSGSAPLYADWKVRIYVQSEEGTVLETVPVDMKLSGILPGTKLKTSTALGTPGLLKKDVGGNRVSVGIVDPMTGRDAVRLSMDAEQSDMRTVLFP